MPMIRVEDIIQSTLWTQDLINESPVLKNILDSGILTTNTELEKVVNSVDAGMRFELPFIDEPDYVEPEVMDDSDNEITSRKVSWNNMFAILGLYATAWGYANITQIINRGKDPAQVLRDIIAKYWSKDLQNRIIASLIGISNKAGDELVLDVADDSDDDSKTQLLTSDVIIDGVSKLGDHQDKFQFMFIHSKVYADLKKQNLIETVMPSEVGAEPIQMYGNYRVIVNDLLPVEEGEHKKKYTTIVAQTGIFAYSQKKLEEPFAIAKNEKAGRGAGKTELISRNGFVLHPLGFSWKKSGLSPTLADLKNKNSWDMKWIAKQQKFVVIKTN